MCSFLNIYELCVFKTKHPAMWRFEDLLFNNFCVGVFVLLPLEPTRIRKPPENITVQRGRSVVFECEVDHDATLFPTMTWLKDDGELPDEERSAPCFYHVWKHLILLGSEGLLQNKFLMLIMQLLFFSWK